MMAEKIKTILEKEYTPLEKGLAVACTFFVGIIIGFVLSPVKKGIMFIWIPIVHQEVCRMYIL